jgi:hypothetical protein
MARKTAFNNTVIYGPNVVGEVSSNTITASTAFYVDSTQLDERTVFVVTPGATGGTLTISAGTGYAATQDLELSVAKAAPYAFTLDSARFAIASGEDAGLIKMTLDKAGTFEILQPKV